MREQHHSPHPGGVSSKKTGARWANECTAPWPRGKPAPLGVGSGGETKGPGGNVGRSRICERRSPLLLLESGGKCSVHMFRRCHRNMTPPPSIATSSRILLSVEKQISASPGPASSPSTVTQQTTQKEIKSYMSTSSSHQRIPCDRGKPGIGRSHITTPTAYPPAQPSQNPLFPAAGNCKGPFDSVTFPPLTPVFNNFAPP